MHEFMHYCYDRITNKPERYIHMKAIENIGNIIKHYDIITHPQNKKKFENDYRIPANLLTKQDLIAVYKYLKGTSRLF